MEDEYGVERRTARRSTTYRSKPRTEYVSSEEELVGLYRFTSPYPLFEKPEHYTYTQSFYPIEGSPMAIVTGKVFLVNGLTIAYEIITTDRHGEPMICWTIPNCLTHVPTEEP